MSLDVAFTPLGLPPSDLAGRPILVIDILRATTTMIAALHHGARAVIVAGDPGEAGTLAQQLDRRDVLLAGERNCEKIPGFALGNSPREVTPDVVRGKTLVMTTTNGTRALLATAGARDVAVAAAVNLTVAGAWAEQAYGEHGDLMILCAGRDHGFGMDDAYLAGLLTVAALGGRRTRKGLNDAAIVAVDLVRRYGNAIDRVLTVSGAGRQLHSIGYREDVIVSGQRDLHPVLPFYRDRRVTLPAGGFGAA